MPHLSLWLPTVAGGGHLSLLLLEGKGVSEMLSRSVVEPTTALEMLAEMVAVNTVNPQLQGPENSESPMHILIESWVRSWGFDSQRLAITSGGSKENFNLLITHTVSEEAPWIIFESHSDTVGVEGMTIDPFTMSIQNGRIYGRGVCDTKGSGAAMLWALKDYATLSRKNNNVALLFAIDEEISKIGAHAFLTDHLPNLGWRPRGIVVGEPSSCELIVAHNGVIRWKVIARGVPAHSSNPANGKSAISAMARFVSHFEKEYCEKVNNHHYLTGKAACSINTISGGTSINIIPARCEVGIDRRILPGEVISEVIGEFTEVFNQIVKKDPSIVFEQMPPFIDPALDPDTNRDFAGEISQILSEMNYISDGRGVGYGTDASTYATAGIPTVVLGPGNIEQAHTLDEWMLLSELQKATDIYLEIMKMAR